jgi:hypothetical protein
VIVAIKMHRTVGAEAGYSADSCSWNSGYSKLEFVVVSRHGIRQVLPNNKPIGGNRLGVCRSRGIAAIVIVKLTPKIKQTSDS